MTSKQTPPDWLVEMFGRTVPRRSSESAFELACKLLARAIAVQEPFPWQCALLERFLQGPLPENLDVPTGLGKTAVMAIWLVARALGAPVPRRLVYVVDRRAVVDQATDVAEQLRSFVKDTAELHQALGLAEGRDLPISTLRGKFVDNRRWLADPSSPAIMIGTVDMVGSRLLFEGYGVSSKLRSYHAGMLGTDALLVLDEAHLVPAFERMVRAVANGVHEYGPRESTLGALLPPFRLLSLSATGNAETGLFRLTSNDLNHPIVRKRLDAVKSLTVRPAIDSESVSLSEALANEAWSLCPEGAGAIRAIVFCNSRGDAQKVYEALQARISKASKAKLQGSQQPIALLVGERRVFERQQVSEWLSQRGFIAGSQARSDYPCFLVATSAGEVGIDLDADHMVSDLVAWERMVQRLGRVNRRGDGDATVTVVPRLPNKKESAALEKPPEDCNEDERNLATRWRTVEAALRVIERLPRNAEGCYDASPGALAALGRQAEEDDQLREELARATTAAPLCPALSRAVIESWSMTSLDEHTGRPDVRPWLRGWVDDEPQTEIVWRKLLPVNEAGGALEERETTLFFAAAAPHALETLQVETSRVIPWLARRVEMLLSREHNSDAPANEGAEKRDSEPQSDRDGIVADSDSAQNESNETTARRLQRNEVIAFVLPRDGKPKPITAGNLVSKERTARRALMAIEQSLTGGTLVVSDRIGGLMQGLLNERSNESEDIASLGEVLPFRVGKLTASGAEDSAISKMPGNGLEQRRWRKELELTVERDHEETPTLVLTVWTDLTQSAATEEARSVGPAQLLLEHQEWAETQANRIAGSLGLPAPYLRMLGIAARLHDEGKAADRWQRAFGGKPGGPWGKTENRPNQQLLDGYRHELGSLLMVEQHPALRELPTDLRDLCLHLITAHHGYARPAIRTQGCERLPPTALRGKAQEVALRFSRLEKRWGPWGLAWWETLLRAADQEASRLNDARAKEPRRG